MEFKMKKIIFPAVAAFSIMGTGFATLTTIYNPNGSAQMVDTAITGGQQIQLPVGGQILQGPAVACISAVTVLVVASNDNNVGSCFFSVNEAFGASAAAGSPAATILAKGDCSKVSLNFIQKANAQGTTSIAIYVPDKFKEITMFYQGIYANKITFYSDSDLTQVIPVITDAPQKLRAYTPFDKLSKIAYLKNLNDYRQFEDIIASVSSKIPKNVLEDVATRFRGLIEYRP
ncbi:MAG: hypothetical protein CNLJKLNK_01092 [Holosporales bacterium]